MQSSLYHSILVRITTVKRIFQAKLNLLEQLKIVAHNNFHRKKVRERLLVKAYLQAEELASHSKRFSFESILKKAPIWIQNEMNRQEKKRKRHFKSISKSTRILLPTSILSKFKIQEFFHLAISLEKTFEKIVLIPILIIALVLEKLGFRVFEKRLVRFLSKGFRLWITVICYLAVFQSLRAVDFDDLKETSPGFFGREKIYGSEKEKRYAIDGFFIEWERWPRTNPTHSSFHLFWFLNQVNYPKYQRSQLFPLYLSESSKVDQRYEANHLLLSNYSKEKDGSYAYRLFPFLWFGNGAGKSHHGVFPLYYKSKMDTANQKEDFLVMPFYFGSSESTSDEEKTFSLSPLHFNSNTKAKQISENRFFAPIVPLYYSYSDEAKIQRNYLGFIDTEKDKKSDSISRVWVMPVFYWREKSYLNVFPLFFRNVAEDEKSGAWYGLAPPVYYSYSPLHSTFYLLNYYSTSNQTKEKSETFTAFAPFYFQTSDNTGYSQILIPGLYYSETNADKSTHKNITLLYDHIYDKKEKLDRLFIAPFLFYKKDSYLNIAPFYFSSLSKSEEYRNWYSFIPPIYYSRSPTEKIFYILNYYSSSISIDKNSSDFTTIAPVYFNWSNNKGYNETIVPFIYYSKTKEDSSSYKNVFLIYSQVNDHRGKLNQILVSPIFFYKRDSYFHFAPLYWNWRSDEYDETSKITQADNYLLFPFFYHESKKRASYTNILGLVSREYDHKGKLAGSMFAPFYFYKKDSYEIIFPFLLKKGMDNTDKKGTQMGLFYYNDWNSDEETLLAGNYYSHKDIKDNSYFRTLFPIYYEWKNKKWSGEVTPFYLTLDFPNRDRFHLNASGYSYSLNVGTIESDKKLGKFHRYVDADYSWLGYAVRISTRTTFDFLEEGQAKETVDTLDITPSLSKKKSFTRENSKQFYGVNLLFGLYGWEMGDTKRHIRAFPLTWLTWDTRSNDKVITAPPIFVHYSSEDLRYTVLFPFYGNQKTKESERTSIALIGYIDEEIQDKNIKEKSILWPLINWHSSDLKTSSRFIPFYWHRKQKEEIGLVTNFITPFFYHNQTVEKNGNEVANTFSPLWFRFESKDQKDSLRQHFTIPIYYYRENISSVDRSELFLSLPYNSYTEIDGTSKKPIRKTIVILPTYYNKEYAKTANDTENTKFYSPLYIYNGESNQASKKEDFSWFLPIPFLYHSYETDNDRTYWNWLAFVGYEDAKTFNHARVFPLYSHAISKDITGSVTNVTRWIFPTYYEKNYAKTPNQTETTKFYSPLYIYNGESNQVSKKEDFSWFLPIPFLYHSYETANERNYWNWLGFAGYEDTKTFNHARVFPLYSHAISKDKTGSVTNVTRWIFPTYYEKNYAKTANQTETTKFYSPLYIYNGESNQASKKEDFSWFLPIPFLYHSYETDNDRTYWNWLAFVGYEDAKTFNHARVFPLYSHAISKDVTGSVTSVTRWILPTYYEKNYAKTSNDTENIKFYSPLYIYNRESNQASKEEDFSWFLPIPFLYHSYETANERTYWNWLVFAGYEDTKTFNHARVFPLYSHAISKDKTGSVTNVTRWIFPTYYEKNYAKTANDTENTKFYSPLYIYNGESNQASKKEDFSWFLPIPFLYHSYETDNDRTYWNWLAFVGYEDAKTFNHARIFPLYSHAISKDVTGSVTSVTRWILPTYYEKNYAKTSNDTENIKFYSPLYIYNRESNQASKKEDFSWFLPIPFLYHSYETANERNYWNWLGFAQYENAKNKKSILAFPVLYMKEENKKYSALIVGLYLDSNAKQSYLNFLLLTENEHNKETEERKVNLLLRTLQFAKSKEKFNFKLLYGAGGVEKSSDVTDVHLLWLEHENKKDSLYNNFLPIYYNKDTGNEKRSWFTPTLSYSKKDTKEKLNVIGLGSLYYNKEDLEKKEDHMNILMGALYYNNSIPKERGYKEHGSLWGLLWEYKSESETKYSKISVLKFVYSKTTDETGESYQRIMGVRL